MSVIFSLVYIVLLGMPAFAAKKSVDLVPEGAWFVQTEKIPVPPLAEEVSVVYGNEQFGYFERSIEAGDKAGAPVDFSFVPPTYKFPIRFEVRYVLPGGEKIRKALRQRKYESPVSKRLRGSVSGELGFNFFLLNGFVPDSSGKKTFVPLVMNRWGEVVWSYRSARDFSLQLFFDFDAEQNFLILSRRNESTLLRLSPLGELLEEVEFKKKGLPENSHGFQFLPQTNEIIYLAYDCRSLPWYREFLPLFSWGAHFWERIHLPERTYRGNRLIRAQLKEGTFREVWNTFQSFSPRTHRSLFQNTGENSPDHFQDVQNIEQYRYLIGKPYEYGPGDSKCHVDWTHANSVQYIPGTGYLVTIRNLNKLVLLTEAGKVEWTLGEGSENNYFFEYDGSAFGMPHHARWIGKNRIILFNNNAPYRGNPKAFERNQVMELTLPAEYGKIRAIRRFRTTSNYSLLRGSVAQLDNGNYLAYSSGNPHRFERLYEFDANSRAIRGQIRWGKFNFKRGVEVRHFMTFGRDVFHPSDSSKAHAPKPDEPLDEEADAADNLIDATY